MQGARDTNQLRHWRRLFPNQFIDRGTKMKIDGAHCRDVFFSVSSATARHAHAWNEISGIKSSSQAAHAAPREMPSLLERKTFRFISPAVRAVTLNLANKFSQCTFSVTEHYDLFSGLIIIRQAWWRRSYDVIPHRPHRTDRETAAGKAQRCHTDLKLIYMLPIRAFRFGEK